MRPRATITVAMAVLLTGEWHVVELMAAGRNMTMRVDGGAARTIINDGDQHQFSELSEQPLYLGGLPASRRTAAKKKYHVRNTDSFNGTLAVALCLSVRLSVTSWYSIEATGRIEPVFGMEASFDLC